MKNAIKNHIDDPARHKERCRSDKKGFEEAFREIYPEIVVFILPFIFGLK